LPAGLSRHARADDEPLVPRRTYVGNPDYESVRISHDGRNLAYLAPVDGVMNLWLAPVSAPQSGRPLTRVTDRNLDGYFTWAYTNEHIVFFREDKGDENWRAASVDIDSGAILPLTPEHGVKSFVQATESKFPDELLLRHNARDKRMFDLFRVNVVTGKSELVYENHEYPQLLTDADFRLRLGFRFAPDGTCEVFERQEDGAWKPFTTVAIGDLNGTDYLEFSADGKTLYLRDSRGRDKSALFAYDMATGKTTLLAEDEEADIVWVSFFGHRPLAAAAETGRERWHPIDPETADDLKLLAAHSPGDIQFISRSSYDRQATVFFHRDNSSAEFALLDREARTVERLYLARAALDTAHLQEMKPVTITARDGLKMIGYLTVPTGAAEKLPMVLLIHGGPYGRDAWGYEPYHQWLANRGYAVLSVNYRGSTGFGKAFVTAADHEWGGKMHDDLIDAVDWAIAQGIADPARVGFMGGSYGGYSALVAATKTPERFACIVDLFGPSNLITLMKTIPPYWGPEFSVWKMRVGNPDTEEGQALLAERSPINHLDRATKPILIAQGMRDVRVVPAESAQMVAALKAKGVPVTYITFADEGHGFVRPENRLACDAVIEAFLAAHLGGRHQPVGSDFSGSTIKIETGAELIPGLG
jgi:dipeptidyl aminopeptidase/acylaminoacyl peptidase